MYYPRLTKVIIHHFLAQDKTLSWRNKIRMHTSEDDYLINTLRFVFAKEETQIYGAILLDSLTSPEMKETKAYKNYIGFASVLTEEPTGKSKRVKRTTKKTTKALARGVVIRETPEIPVSKRRKRWMLLETHPSGSGAVKIIPSVTSKGTSVKPGVLDVTEEESSESEAESWGNDEDDRNNKQDSNSDHETKKNESSSESDQEEDEDDEEEVKDESVKTLSNDSDDEDETKIADKAEGDEDEEMDYTTSQLYDDVDIRLNETVDADKGFKTRVPVTSSSHSSDLAAKFLNFLDIPHTDAEFVL
ncbi:hypothetical protein Tco_1023851 [Tanacetum coccineum]